MAKKRPACGRPIIGTRDGPCWYDRMPGRQMCIWHWLLRQSPQGQQTAAQRRLSEHVGDPVARVPKAEWPEGERWCAGCQSFVPLFYTTGSRCKACASAAAHEQRIEKVYGIDGETYKALLKLQRGVCYICHRAPKTKRLAVDHDHETGRVRGLLCPDNERGCNMAVLGGLSTAKDGALAAARRAVEYLEDPPYDRLMRSYDDPDDAPGLARLVAQSPAEPPRADLPAWML
mgnify:CR=1 FL=1